MATNYGLITEYISYLKTFKRSATIRPGYFYLYNYAFYEHYPIEELKFYDYWPLTFVFQIMRKPQGQYFLGMNFHHMPVKARQYWLNRVKRMARVYFEKGGVRRLPAFNYDNATKVMRKGKLTVRQYRNEAVRNLRIVPLEELDTLMKFYAKTYYGVTIAQVRAKYLRERV